MKKNIACDTQLNKLANRILESRLQTIYLFTSYIYIPQLPRNAYLNENEEKE